MNKIEEKYGLKPSQTIVLFVILVLNIIWFVCDLIMSKGQLSITVVLQILMFVAAMVYALSAYKTPHGNFMRYLLLAYNLFGAIMVAQFCKNQETYMNIIDLVVIMLIAYMAGRLDHYKQNIIICVIVLLKTILVSMNFITNMSNSGMLNFITFFSCTGSITCWLAIASSYIIRYRLHKKAGLEEKKN